MDYIWKITRSSQPIVGVPEVKPLDQNISLEYYSFPNMYELKTLMSGCWSDVPLRHQGVVLLCLVKTVISYIDVLDVHTREQLPIILLYYCYSRYIREICRCTGRRHIWKRRLNVGMTQVLPIRRRHIRIYLRERVRFFSFY